MLGPIVNPMVKIKKQRVTKFVTYLKPQRKWQEGPHPQFDTLEYHALVVL